MVDVQGILQAKLQLQTCQVQLYSCHILCRLLEVQRGS